ncbi:MAG TPA: nucleotidyltransferase domain-containing protein [Acidobacteriota bacterium]|nr:nucleotidyltransferase domain-containing protein [Acidobacteriota bacterium]
MEKTAIEELFSNRVLTDLLVIFMLHPDEEYHQRRLAQNVEVAHRSVQLNLKRLERLGLINSRTDGNRVAYKANRDSPIFDDIRRIILKTRGFGDLLRESLEHQEGKIEVAFIYGSVASGTDGIDSDIDLMIIGDLSARTASRAISKVKGILRREVNVSVYQKEEFRNRVLTGNHFASRIIEADKLYLIGDDETLSGICQEEIS